eukprot:1380496-Pleurochrysis_carterae.AAC.1
MSKVYSLRSGLRCGTEIFSFSAMHSCMPQQQRGKQATARACTIAGFKFTFVHVQPRALFLHLLNGYRKALRGSRVIV